MVYLLSLGVFLLVIMSLVFVLYIVEQKVIGVSDCQILINDDAAKSPTVSSGTNLLGALSNAGVFLPSACGGGGTCAMCKVQVLEGAGDALPTELPHLSIRERKTNVRLGCQVKVKNDIKIKIPDEIFSIKKFECEVISNDNVATFIKDLRMKLPESLDLDFRAGGYIQIYIPPYQLNYKSFDIGEEYRPDWDNFKLWDVDASNKEEIFRAYSMANYPEEKGVIYLNVRIASPPPGSQGIPAGIGSSYIFDLKPGDKVMISGPYGEFFAQETQREMCFIGGGAGMAPMRSHIFDQLKRIKTDRKMTFWYGARSLREMFYDDEFKQLEADNPNFSYHVALSDPQPEDQWEGMTGFIHQCLLDNFLSQHEDPTEVEYYLCGPPMMLKCCMDMLDDLGVEKEMILFDDFG
ncbi:MAG: NADH:ubiquinone reductase (Na(+)-transporting) subunit F [Actinobacteria bacterium]|nr:NADH:ubiquinone reductase (Na(+)-transporting) subunit F [Actinomycetota bacterium]|tara:strand:+ start:356 stop:1576 length:1221 start_codon:yes stop_codon:yes gene_type:complete